MTDTERLEFLMPCLSLTETVPEQTADARTLRLAGALLLGKTGRDAIDSAITEEKALDKATQPAV